MNQEQNWRRLGVALKDARTNRRPRLTQADVADALSFSRATVQNIERGKVFGKVSTTHRAYARLVGWSDDSVERVLAGGDPTQVVEASAEPVAARDAGAPVPEGLPLRVAEELANGPLLDTMVIPLPGGGQAVVVARGKQNGTPEEIQAAMEAWRRAQPRLQEIEAGGEEPPESAA